MQQSAQNSSYRPFLYVTVQVDERFIVKKDKRNWVDNLCFHIFVVLHFSPHIIHFANCSTAFNYMYVLKSTIRYFKKHTLHKGLFVLKRLYCPLIANFILKPNQLFKNQSVLELNYLKNTHVYIFVFQLRDN